MTPTFPHLEITPKAREGMRIRERYKLAAELKDRYRRATKRERGELLDAFCLASGYERKHAT